MTKANFSNIELDKLFNLHDIPRITRGKGTCGGSVVPTINSVNSNNVNNEYNVKRDENKKAINNAREVILERDQKVNGAMAVSGGAKKKEVKPKKEKETLKKEVGISNKLKWTDFVKEIRKVAPDLQLKDAMKVGSAMKKKGMYKLDDVNQQNVTMIYNDM